LRQTTLGFEEKAFLYDALMFFKRTFDPIHMIAVSIWHPTNDLVIARSRVTKKHIRNAGNYFTNGELMHRLTPPEFERFPLLSLHRDTTIAREPLGPGQAAHTVARLN
jgi:hypothetical protein